MYGFNLKAKIQQRNIFYLCGRFRTQHNHRLHKGHRTHLPYVFFCKTIYKIQNVPMSLVPGSYVLRFYKFNLLKGEITDVIKIMNCNMFFLYQKKKRLF